MKNLLRKEKLNETQTVNLVLKKIGNQIYTGPFAGLKIPEIVKLDSKLAEVLGLYEYALHPIFSSLVNRSIDDIMVIGGHKGYYPAGLSNLLRPQNMHVFEMDEKFLPLIESWIEPNELKGFQIYGEATFQILENWNHNIDFLLIDCEGAEDFLLQPDVFKWQQNSDILVEVHHFYNHKIMGNLVERFKKSHDLEIIYDDISENDRIQNIIDELGVKGSYRKQPLHRWIFDQHKHKIITAGVFLNMKAKSKS